MGGAVSTPMPDCPKCGGDRGVKREGDIFFCETCAHDWPVVRRVAPDVPQVDVLDTGPMHTGLFYKLPR